MPIRKRIYSKSYFTPSLILEAEKAGLWIRRPKLRHHPLQPNPTPLQTTQMWYSPYELRRAQHTRAVWFSEYGCTLSDPYRALAILKTKADKGSTPHKEAYGSFRDRILRWEKEREIELEKRPEQQEGRKETDDQ